MAQSRQRNALDRAQIDHKGAQVWPERRSRLQALRRLGLEALGATRADAAMQRHPRHVGLDLRDFDAVIGSRTGFARRGYVGAAALAALAKTSRLAVGLGCKRTMRPGMRLGLALGRGWLRRLLPLRRRNAGIVGRLRRQAQLRLKFGDPRDKRLDPRDQCGDQGVFLGQIRRRCHPKVDSYSRCRRNQKNTVPNTGPSSHPQTGREQLPLFYPMCLA